MIKLAQKIEHCPRSFIALICLILLIIVGVVDYLTGYEILFSIFYLYGVGLATWYLGIGYGFFMSILSVTIWITGDIAAGAHYSNSLVPIWNAAILLVFYVIVTLLLARLRSFNSELEERITQRTHDLTQEMAERERLEKEIMEVSEREQHRLGRDLHDGLCQHLTATALAGQVLRGKLEARCLPEVADASNIVRLVEDGITMARDLAHGLLFMEMDDEGLMVALQELARSIDQWSKVKCIFASDATVQVQDATTATHLYRIAQEALGNAIRHGNPEHIIINLAQHGDLLVLSVEDDGVGLPENWCKGSGLGTRIMAHRAAMIGSMLTIEPNPTGGTLVKCSMKLGHKEQHV